MCFLTFISVLVSVVCFSSDKTYSLRLKDGEIISRFEKKGFLVKGLKLFQCPTDLAQVCFKNALNLSKLLSLFSAYLAW